LHFLLEEAHVARAARRLGITAAATSNALRRLREEFDDPLLVRAGRTLSRTELAEDLREPAREVLAAAERLFNAAERFEARTYGGNFVLTCSDRVALVLLEVLDRLLSERAPRAGLHLRQVPQDVPALLRDVGGVALGPCPPHRGEICSELLFTDTFVCVLRKGHPLLVGPWSARRFAAAEHVLVAPRGESDRGDVDLALEAKGLSRRVGRVVSTFGLSLPLLVQSDRVATLPLSFVQRQAEGLGLIVRPPPLKLPPFKVQMAWHQRHDREPSHLWLRALLHEAADQSGLK
jgi:DNA-binding transcriptional LysR family regulator